jgi:hypothetical protein
MRKIFILLTGATQLIGLCAFAQLSAPTTPVDLYVSRQTGQYSIYAGSASKTTDQYEEGNVAISVSGPLLYRVDPNDFSIGHNQTKTWYGVVWADPSNAPTPGTTVPASITGNYNVTFSKPAPGTATGHQIVNQNGKEVVNFNVNSVNVTTADSLTLCRNTDRLLYANGYPDGGTYAWTATGNVSITANANSQQPTIRCANLGSGTATVTYTVKGVSYRATTQVNAVNPSMRLSVPDTIRVGINEQFRINVTLVPSGGVAQWTVTNGIHLNSGPYSLYGFLTATAGGWQTVTLRATVCGQQITKVVRVYVNPCQLYASDSVVILQNNNTDISVSCNATGTYSWTSGNNINIQAGGTTSTVTVRGNTVGRTGWAEVAFSNATCNIRKRIRVVVLARPTLRIYATFGNLAQMCKTERRILNAAAQPTGGTISWALSTNSLTWYGAGTGWNPVVEAARGGPCRITATYTVSGQTVTATADVYVNEYSRIDLTPSVRGDVNSGTQVTYTATVYDYAGRAVNPPPTLHWKVVYIPIGRDRNVGDWVSYDLQGGGATMQYTWSFPQGNFPLPGGGPPYRMRAWIEAAEYCTYHSGSVHMNVISNGNAR